MTLHTHSHIRGHGFLCACGEAVNCHHLIIGHGLGLGVNPGDLTLCGYCGREYIRGPISWLPITDLTVLDEEQRQGLQQARQMWERGEGEVHP